MEQVIFGVVVRIYFFVFYFFCVCVLGTKFRASHIWGKCFTRGTPTLSLGPHLLPNLIQTQLCRQDMHSRFLLGYNMRGLAGNTSFVGKLRQGELEWEMMVKTGPDLKELIIYWKKDIIRNVLCGAGEMDHWLRACISFPEDLSYIPSIYVRQLTTICDTSFKGSDSGLFRHPPHRYTDTPHIHVIHSHTHT